jgi:hypothetical protein
MKYLRFSVWLCTIGLLPASEFGEWPYKTAYASKQDLMADFGNVPKFEAVRQGRPVIACSPTVGSGIVTRYLYIYKLDRDRWNCIYFKRADGLSPIVELADGHIVITAKGLLPEVVWLGDQAKRLD